MKLAQVPIDIIYTRPMDQIVHSNDMCCEFEFGKKMILNDGKIEINCQRLKIYLKSIRIACKNVSNTTHLL